MTVPGQEIIKQGAGFFDSRDMYFLVKGSVIVHVDAEEEMTEERRILEEGAHFGEVSLVEVCERTASVNSRDYSTMGAMSYDAFLQVNHYFPQFK